MANILDDLFTYGLFGLYPDDVRELIDDRMDRKLFAEDANFLAKSDPCIAVISETCFRLELAAITLYRIYHEMNLHHLDGIRLWQINKSITGVDIHPDAQIGVPFALDHAVGTVIGQTAIIGQRCLLYHGVTLGAKRHSTAPRHPILGNDVTIGCGATILGRVTIPDKTFVKAGSLIIEE